MAYETKQITGYKWSSLSAAENAQNAARVHFGLPVDGGTTLEYFEPITSYKANGSIDFYFFEGDISPVLGSTSTFNVRTFYEEL